MKYTTEATPQIEASMQRVTSLFEQYVKLCQSLNYETMIAAVRMEDPAQADRHHRGEFAALDRRKAGTAGDLRSRRAAEPRLPTCSKSRSKS